MKEHPILFSTPMVKAILEGRKTQTRRVHKHQIDCEKLSQYAQEWEIKEFIALCPFGQPGDRLYVRETFSPPMAGQINTAFMYKADYAQVITEHKNIKGIWKPSIHMPKTAARIWLEVEEVKVERLQDISEEDAKAEGVQRIGQRFKNYYQPGKTVGQQGLIQAIKSFNTLWNEINGEESWEANPWVWVIKFKVLSTTGAANIIAL